MRSKALYVVGLFALLLPLKAWPASSYLTDTQFMHRGVGAFIGEITAVQVQSSDKNSESGTVQLKITSIMAGTISTPTITLTYTRALQPTDDASNWDNIAPTYVSLRKIGVGRSVLIYFTQNNGAYFLAPAGNSVQDAATGFLLGKIKKDDHQLFSREHMCGLLQVQVQVQIIEVIYGWVGGSSTISSCVDLSSLLLQKISTAGDSSKMGLPAIDSLLTFNNVNSNWSSELEGKELFITFDGSGIRSISVASNDLVKQLQQMDTH